MKEKHKKSGLWGRILRRFLLVLITIPVLAVTALCLVLNLVFNGPSPTARDVLTMSLIEASGTKWVPGLFLEEEVIAQIRKSADAPLPDDVSDTSAIVIRREEVITENSEWDNSPDGIRIEEIQGDTYNAYVMIVRDPGRVYLGISAEDGFSKSKPEKRLNHVIEEEGVAAAINGGAFFDDSSSSPQVGSVPEGLTYSEGVCVWTAGAPSETKGFAGFNQDDVLVVHTENITKAQAEELNIRDGCCFGPVLIMNGEVNMEAYNNKSGCNPRTAIGQRADGAVIFVCIDGRQVSSMGGTYADIINIMQEYGAVNACNMDGGSSTVMMYRDVGGLYGEAGEIQMINNYSLLQSEPRRMPDYWLVSAE